MTNHAKISYIKSGIRILGYWTTGYIIEILWAPMVVLMFAEVLGVVEEWGE